MIVSLLDDAPRAAHSTPVAQAEVRHGNTVGQYPQATNVKVVARSAQYVASHIVVSWMIVQWQQVRLHGTRVRVPACCAFVSRLSVCARREGTANEWRGDDV